MSAPGQTRKLRIAISGGGLAGAAIANALFRQPHLDVHVYESAPEFSERGAAIGLGINAQRALALIVPDVKELLQKAGAVSKSSTRIMIGSGPAAGTKVIDIAEKDQGYTIHRAALLHELLAPMPQDCLHAGMKLVRIEDTVESGDASIMLHFADGSSSAVDALIGADGIFGSVRQHVLGADNPTVEPVPAGWAGAMNMVPFAKASAKLGTEVFEGHRQYGWVGDGGIFIHDTLNNKQLAMCIGTTVDASPSKERRAEVSRTSLEKSFAPWLQGSEAAVARGMIDLLLDQENPAAYAQVEHLDAPTYAKDNVCIAGDAAHAMTPWQGSGAGMALEDAMILGAVFSAIESADQVQSALKVYDRLRRPRTQRIAASSRETGRILSGREKSVGLDPEKMRDALASRWDYIYDFDLKKHREESVMALKGLSSDV